MLDTIKEEACKLSPQLTAWRRRFHQKPELSFAETGTTEEICRILTELGVEGMKVGVSGVETGVVVDLRGPSPGKMIALRADIDALPVQEQNDVEYRSQNAGVMHACGHDGHIAMLLGAAAILRKHQNELPGAVRLIFQPSEEAGDGGAKPMIEEGALKNVDAIAAMHLWQPVKNGVFGYTKGAIMASSDKFTITVRGKGGHGAYPHQTIDPVVTASFIVCQLQTIISREINPLDAGVITVGKITSGSASNIIPEIAIIEGTVRSLDSATRSYLHESIARMAECVAKAHRCSVGTEFLNGYPPTVNSAPFVKRAIVIAEELVDKQNMLEVAPTMGAEDMGYFLEKVPGCFFFLGIGGEHPHHSPRFDIDENMLHTGSAFLAGVAWDFLQDTSLYGV